MLPWLIVFFTVLPALELYALLEVGGAIGGWNTILIILVTGIVGASLAKHQGLRVLVTMNEQVAKGLLPTDALLDGVLILVAGALLLTPGFLTDSFGFLLLLPPVRLVFRTFLKRRFSKHVRFQTFGQSPTPGFGPQPFGDVNTGGRATPPASSPDSPADNEQGARPKKQQVEIRPGVFVDMDD